MADAERYQLEGNAAQLYERDIVPTLTKPQAELMLDHVKGDLVRVRIAQGDGPVRVVRPERDVPIQGGRRGRWLEV